jgi:predicted PurR-regulated permease PerM
LDRDLTTPEGDEGRDRPDLTRFTRRLRGPLGIVAVATTVLALIATFTVLHMGRAFFLPLVLAVLLKFLLMPVLDFLKDRGLPAPIGSVVILVSFLGLLALGGARLAGPVAEWVNKAPQSLSEARLKLEELKEPVEAIQRAGEEVEKLTDVSGGGEGAPPQATSDRPLSAQMFEHARGFLVGSVLVVFLLYFLLAADDLFLRKLARVLPSMAERRKAVVIIESIERDLSRYIFVRTLMNAAFGAAVGVALWLVGMPNPVLWGVLAGVLNYVPYLGGLVGYVVVGFAALLSFDSTGRALLAPAVYFGLNVIEGNFLAPIVLGRQLRLNPVMIFVFLIFWAWIWGVPGALLAVPILAATKIVADNVAALNPLGEFLGR